MRALPPFLLSLITVAFSVSLLLSAGLNPAFAHAKLAASVPKNGATVPAGLTEIQLTFSKPMRLTRVRLMAGTEGKEIAPTGELPKTFVKETKVAVPPLGAGAYEVSWSAVAEDGHVMNGSFKFGVSAGDGAAKAGH